MTMQLITVFVDNQPLSDVVANLNNQTSNSTTGSNSTNN